MGSNRKKPGLKAVEFDAGGGFMQWIGNTVGEDKINGLLPNRSVARRRSRTSDRSIGWLSAQLHWAEGARETARQSCSLPELWAVQWIEQGRALGGQGAFSQLANWHEQGRHFSVEKIAQGALEAFDGARTYLLDCEQQQGRLSPEQAWGLCSWASAHVREHGDSPLRILLGLRGRFSEWKAFLALAARVCARSDFESEAESKIEHTNEEQSQEPERISPDGQRSSNGLAALKRVEKTVSSGVASPTPALSTPTDKREVSHEEPTASQPPDPSELHWHKALEACERSIETARTEKEQTKQRLSLASQELKNQRRKNKEKAEDSNGQDWMRTPAANAEERIELTKALKGTERPAFALQEEREAIEEQCTPRSSVVLLLLLNISMREEHSIEWADVHSKKPMGHEFANPMMRHPFVGREWPEFQHYFWRVERRGEENKPMSRTQRRRMDSNIRVSLARAWAARHETPGGVPRDPKQAKQRQEVLDRSPYWICASECVAAQPPKAALSVRFWRELLWQIAQLAWERGHRFESEGLEVSTSSEAATFSEPLGPHEEADSETAPCIGLASAHWFVFHAVLRLAEQTLGTRASRAKLLSRAAGVYLTVHPLTKSPGESWHIQAEHKRFSLLEMACAHHDEGFLRWAHQECDQPAGVPVAEGLVAEAERAYAHTLEEVQAQFSGVWNDRMRLEFSRVMDAQRRRHSAWEAMALEESLQKNPREDSSAERNERGATEPFAEEGRPDSTRRKGRRL